ncbi:hypothetical protein KUCAC02_029614, partial [Chaenocephalus aceratus]
VSEYARWAKDKVFCGPLVEERGLNTRTASSPDLQTHRSKDRRYPAVRLK